MLLHGGSSSAEVWAVKLHEINLSPWSYNVSCEGHTCVGKPNWYYFSLTTLPRRYPQLCENGQQQINSEKKYFSFLVRSVGTGKGGLEHWRVQGNHGEKRAGKRDLTLCALEILS